MAMPFGEGEPEGADEPIPAPGAESKEPLSDFDREAADVFDDTLPMESRSMALKEAIKLCMKEDYGSSGSVGGSEPGGEKPKSGLALILGVPKKK